MPRLALLLATCIWGATFVVVGKALTALPIFHLLAYRFTLGALLLLPLALGGGRWTRRLLADGLLVGAVLFTGFVLQTSGLLWTTPSRSAFLTGLSVPLVPLIAWMAGGQRVPRGALLGTLVATAGLFVLFRPTGNGAGGFNRGDALTLVGALVFAVYVLVLERAVRRHPIGRVVVLQFTVIALLSAPSLLLQPPVARELSGFPLFAVLATGVLSTAVAFLSQAYAQRHLTAVETGVILTFEPVAAAALSVGLGVEPWTASLGAGGGLVLAAMLLALPRRRVKVLAPGAPHPRA